ncbi:MAG: Rpn family recombination-promoting nuclease/putative transposase [Lachnospiraceae bacterium]|nr:Rpn family recombination-promoting nuclease/putative transposase [Lachnospiraceae bacterium]
MGQKDLTAKDLESRPEVFADIINALIYEGEQVVLPEQLQPAPTETLYENMAEELNEKLGEEACSRLRNQYNDVSKYETEDQRIKIQYVLENESGENYRLILRKAGYEGAVYRSEYEEKQIYPVVILVLYWGDKEWKSYLDLHEFFKDNLKDAILRKYVDNIKLHIFPMARLPGEVRQRFKSDMRIVVDYLAEGESYKPTGQVIKHIESVIRLLYALTGEKELPVILADIQGKQRKGEEIAMAGYFTTYYTAKCTQEGIQQGIQQGMERISNLMRILLDSGRNEDIRRSVEDEEYREKLLREFNL